MHQELQIQLSELTVEQLLEQFALNKHTGLEKPGKWERFKYEGSLKYSPSSPSREGDSNSNNSSLASATLLPSYATGPRRKKINKEPKGFCSKHWGTFFFNQKERRENSF